MFVLCFSKIQSWQAFRIIFINDDALQLTIKLQCTTQSAFLCVQTRVLHCANGHELIGCTAPSYNYIEDFQHISKENRISNDSDSKNVLFYCINKSFEI